MMDKIKCTIIQDILPLYVDEVVCEDTKELVDEHIKTCDECGKIFCNMKKSIGISSFVVDDKKDVNVIKNIKKSIKNIVVKGVIITVVVMLVLYVLIIGAFSFTYNFGILSEADSVECDVREEVDSDYLEDEGENGITIYSYEGTKSNNPEDYRYIWFNVKVKSFCIEDQIRVDAVLSEVKYFEENLLYSYDNTLDIVRFVDMGETTVLPVGLYVYVGDMTEEDIEKFIDGVTIDVIVGGDVRKSVSFSKCEDIYMGDTKE